MKKIYIRGISGSGKTFLAKKLASLLKTKTFDLDEVVFGKKSWDKRVSDTKRDNAVKRILKRPDWIIEGAYSKPWVEPIIKKADIIINIDSSKFVAKKRVFVRWLKRKFVKGVKKESFKDLIGLFQYIDRKPKMDKWFRTIARKYKKKIINLKNKKEVNKFIKNEL